MIRNTVVFVLLSVLGAFGNAWADSIAVNNPGFEADVLADNTSTSPNSPIGWTVPYNGMTPLAGAWNPPTSAYPNEAPEGYNVAYANGITGTDGYLEQTLTGVPLTSGLTYTLQVKVGKRLTGTFPGYIVRLQSGTSILAVDDSTVDPPFGSFRTSTVTYAATEDGADLRIRLISKGIQTNFDDVRLSAVPTPSAVPTMGPYGLLGAAVLMLAATVLALGRKLRK
jgi:hypothetical protein